MTRGATRLGHSVVALVGFFSTLLCVSADACVPLTYADDVRYVGGDLAEQIAREAHTIQVVEVRSRHLLSRHFSSAEIFWNRGQRPNPSAAERYRDIYVFELFPVETLKGGVDTSTPIRARGLDLSDDPMLWQSFGGMVELILDEPAPERRVIRPVAVDPYENTPCDFALALHLGERYLVLRDEAGRVLVPYRQAEEWIGALSIDLENVRTGERYTAEAPGVMSVSTAPEFLARVRAALQAR